MIKFKKKRTTFAFIFLLLNFIFAQNNTDDIDSLIKEFRNNYNKSNYTKSLVVLDQLKQYVKKQTEKSIIKNDNSKQDTNFDSLYLNAKNPIEKKINGSPLTIHYKDKQLYVIDNDPDSYFKSDYLFISSIEVKYKGIPAIENKYLKINESTEIINYSSSDENILTINDSGRFEVKKSGNVIITVSIYGQIGKIPLKIKKLPLREGMTKEQVIATIGLPDKTTERYISYYDGAYVDGIHYYGGDDGIKVIHWIYDKYPDVILRFGYFSLTECITINWKK